MKRNRLRLMYGEFTEIFNLRQDDVLGLQYVYLKRAADADTVMPDPAERRAAG